MICRAFISRYQNQDQHTCTFVILNSTHIPISWHELNKREITGLQHKVENVTSP